MHCNSGSSIADVFGCKQSLAICSIRVTLGWRSQCGSVTDVPCLGGSNKKKDKPFSTSAPVQGLDLECLQDLGFEQEGYQGFSCCRWCLQERARIPKDIVKRIQELNAMDMEVTEYAREVYKRKVVS